MKLRRTKNWAIFGPPCIGVKIPVPVVGLQSSLYEAKICILHPETAKLQITTQNLVAGSSNQNLHNQIYKLIVFVFVYETNCQHATCDHTVYN